MGGYPQFSFSISISLAKISFPREPHKNTSLLVGTLLKQMFGFINIVDNWRQTDHRNEIRVLTFRALALRQSEKHLKADSSPVVSFDLVWSGREETRTAT